MSKKNRNIFGRIKQSFSKISNTLKKPTQTAKEVTDVGSKIEDAGKNKISSMLKDLFTFKGSEQITQIENTVNNVKSAIKDPTGYATEYIKHKILNKLLTVATDALSAVVSKFSSTAGEVVKKTGDAITKKLTTAKKEEEEEETQATEQREEPQEVQEQPTQEEQQQQTQEEQKEPWQVSDTLTEESEEEDNGDMTINNFIKGKLQALPEELILFNKDGQTINTLIDISGYKNDLIGVFMDRVRATPNYYAGIDPSEFMTVYNEFNRDYFLSEESESTVAINYESLKDWLIW